MLKKQVRQFLRGKQRGQSIVLLALGFIFLLGFVGLTTDIALMFVRYSTLRRAVDSAAISAANQMRQDRSIASVSLAARQFVEFHGLNPIDVRVDTCQTLPLELNEANRTDEQNMIIDELDCETDQRKLVRVTAQVESPTVFLRLLPDWIVADSYTLEAAAISETAVLDVVIVMDVSESMLFDTSLEDWAEVGYGKYYVPPHWYDISTEYVYGDPNIFWDEHLLKEAQGVVNGRLVFPGAGDPADSYDDPNPVYEVASYDLPGYPDASRPAGDPARSTNHPREECRVRFWPYSTAQKLANWPAYVDNATGDDISMYQLLVATGWNSSREEWGGFAATYNYYGCCNDPFKDATVDTDGNLILGDWASDGGFDDQSSDFEFSDLICQPFKDARDATFDFLERIDFTRGDRVGFVTFDRSAYLVNPYQLGAQAKGYNPMIESYTDAERTLSTLIGVRAEPNFYITDFGGASDEGYARINGFSSGLDENGDSIPIDYDRVDQPVDRENDALNHLYPASGACVFDNAMQSDPTQTFYDSSLYEIMNPPSPISPNPDSTWTQYWENTEVVGGYTYAEIGAPAVLKASYEQWSACRGTNIGGALREANNALLDPNTSRRFGAVWVIVMLGDGAAGASDPVRRNGDKLIPADPFRVNTDPSSVTGFGNWDAEYGAFGLCPIGAGTSNPGEVVEGHDDRPTSPANDLWVFPFCSDEAADSRHTCDFRPALVGDLGSTAMADNDYVTYSDAQTSALVNTTYEASGDIADWDDDLMNGVGDEVGYNRRHNNLYDVDIGTAWCDVLYDVDDYARDWADVVALEQFNGGGDALLPTIFTIGFGLDFGDPDNPGTCDANIADCLGEQMLRYIADAGDNNRIDNDYFQDFLEDDNPSIRALQGTVADGFGSRGPCQTDYTPPSDSYDTNGNGNVDLGSEVEIMYEPLDPTVSCGNYFNAPDKEELQFVFDTIASRMFTRLAR